MIATDEILLTDDEAACVGDNSDDTYGLWEVDWSFNGYRAEWSHEQRVELVRRLIERGLLDVFYGRMGIETASLKIEDAVAAIEQPANWLPRNHPNQAVYHVSASELALNAMERRLGLPNT